MWASVDWNMVGALASVGALVVGVPGFILSMLSVRRSLRRLESQNEEGVEALKKLAGLRKISDGDQNALWSQPLQPAGFDYHDRLAKSIPILLFANLKGGVGKTTIAGNVAAAFADQGERVLVLDLDYQGSLSSLYTGHAEITDKEILDETKQRGAELLKGQRDAYWAKTAASPVSSDLPRLRFIPTIYDMADVENRLMIKWLLTETDGDARLNLARILLDDEIQKSFDRIIIDTAPRMTLAFVNGICVSTDLVIPTILDDLSTNATVNFLRQIKSLRPRISPHLRLAGIVGSKTYFSEPGRFTAKEQSSIGRLRDQASSVYGHGEHFVDNCNIADKVAIATAAGKRLAYFENPDSKTMFKALADELKRRTKR